MRKVLVFALSVVLALGAIGFVHGAVSRDQEELVFYPVSETGDASVLEGKTAELTFVCGDHLRWQTAYPFGGVAKTEFTFDPEGREEVYGRSDELNVYLNMGFGSSVSGGGFDAAISGYGDMLKAVGATIGPNERTRMDVHMADYVEFYQPDYELNYSGEGVYCYQEMMLHGLMMGDDWHYDNMAYQAFLKPFRFPVQPDQIVTIEVAKDAAGQVVSVDYSPQNGPELRYISDVTDEGIWFVPVFRSETGEPLAYESPEGHGLYHAPWKVRQTRIQSGREVQELAPDMSALELVVPLEEGTAIEDMVIDADSGRAWMLHVEDKKYVLTAFDLTTGERRAMEVLDSAGVGSGTIICDTGYLLLIAEDQLALVDQETGALLLTAPDEQGSDYGADWYDPDGSEIVFEEGVLYLQGTCRYRDGAFWISVYRQGAQLYRGIYDCSLMRGNDDFYYGQITASQDPIILH